MKKHDLQHHFFFSLLLATLALVAFVFLPYFETLALAGAISIFVGPLHDRITAWLGGRQSLAAFLVTIVVVVALALPLSFVGFQVFREARDLYTDISENHSLYLSTLSNWFSAYIQPYVPGIQLDATNILKQGATWIIGHFDDIFTGTVSTFIHLLLTLVALFYFLKDGKRFASMVMSYSPLPDKYDREILDTLRTAVHSVFRGSLLIALIQGTLTGIGLAVFGVPSPALWGSITAICALIPGLGTSLVIVPSIIYLFATGNTLGGIGMTLWGAFAVGLIDNLLAPTLMSKGMRIHPLLILFSVIGGIGLFGPLGFIFGPLSVSLLLALLEIYRILLSKKGERLPF